MLPVRLLYQQHPQSLLKSLTPGPIQDHSTNLSEGESQDSAV